MARKIPKYTLETHEAQIHGLSHEGRGIAHVAEKVTFLDGGLPGEHVSFNYRKKHSKFDEGQVKEILQASEERVEPPCQHFTVCGGCNTQHIDTKAQIYYKQQVLLEQLKHFGENLEAGQVLPPLTGPSLGYRRKARLGVKYVHKKGKVLVGFREKSARYLADLSSCPVLHPSIGLLLTPLAELIAGLSVYQQIAQIEAAVADNTTALIFRNLAPLSDDDLNAVKQFAKTHDLQIYLQPKGPDTVYVIWPETDPKTLNYRLQEYAIDLEFSPSDFIQVNNEINQKLVPSAIKHLDLQANDKVLDLFCGLGNFTLPIAGFCQHVTGVEGSDEMVQRATENAALNQRSNTQFYKADLSQDCQHLPWFKQPYTKILLDPARSGAIDIIQQLNLDHVSRIVYVSCNPATLARDAGILVNEKGFHLSKAGVIDMFPHTSHVESIAVFDRG